MPLFITEPSAKARTCTSLVGFDSKPAWEVTRRNKSLSPGVGEGAWVAVVLGEGGGMGV